MDYPPDDPIARFVNRHYYKFMLIGVMGYFGAHIIVAVLR